MVSDGVDHVQLLKGKMTLWIGREVGMAWAGAERCARGISALQKLGHLITLCCIMCWTQITSSHSTTGFVRVIQDNAPWWD